MFMSIPPFCSADYHSNRDRAPPQPLNAKLSLSKTSKFNLTLYYDSLCPSSRDFIIKDLVKVFMEDLISIVNLRLVPWGNALIVEPNNNIICQVTFWSSFSFIHFFFFLMHLIMYLRLMIRTLSQAFKPVFLVLMFCSMAQMNTTWML